MEQITPNHSDLKQLILLIISYGFSGPEIQEYLEYQLEESRAEDWDYLKGHSSCRSNYDVAYCLHQSVAQYTYMGFSLWPGFPYQK